MKEPVKIPSRGWVLTLEMTEHEAMDVWIARLGPFWVVTW